MFSLILEVEPKLDYLIWQHLYVKTYLFRNKQTNLSTAIESKGKSTVKKYYCKF